MLRIFPLFIFNQFPASFSFYLKSVSRGNLFFCKPHFNIVIELWMASVCNWIRNLSICGSNVVTSDRSLMLTRSVCVCMSLCLIHFSCLFFWTDGGIEGGAGDRFFALFCFSMKLFAFGMHEGCAVLSRNTWCDIVSLFNFLSLCLVYVFLYDVTANWVCDSVPCDSQCDSISALFFLHSSYIKGI